jgi:hypothetical protein
MRSSSARGPPVSESGWRAKGPGLAAPWEGPGRSASAGCTTHTGASCSMRHQSADGDPANRRVSNRGPRACATPQATLRSVTSIDAVQLTPSALDSWWATWAVDVAEAVVEGGAVRPAVNADDLHAADGRFADLPEGRVHDEEPAGRPLVDIAGEDRNRRDLRGLDRVAFVDPVVVRDIGTPSEVIEKRSQHRVGAVMTASTSRGLRSAS